MCIRDRSMIWATYKDAGGIWHEDRFRPLIGATVNLILNIFFVKVVEIGIYGILLSTIVSYVCISMPWLINNLFKIMFKRNCREYVLETIKHIFWTAISCGITYGVCSIVPVSYTHLRLWLSDKNCGKIKKSKINFMDSYGCVT